MLKISLAAALISQTILDIQTYTLKKIECDNNVIIFTPEVITLSNLGRCLKYFNGIPETDRHAALAKIQSLCTIFSKPPNQENKLII